MKKILFTLLILAVSLPAFNQTLENDSLNLDLRNGLAGSISLDRYPNLRERNIFDEQPSSLREGPKVSSEYNADDSLKVNMHIYVPDFYQGPMYNYLSDSKYPFNNDYAYYAGYGITDRSWLTTTSRHDTYLQIGSSRYISATFNYMLTDNLLFSTEAYTTRYTVGMKAYGDAGVNAALKYQLNDRIAIHGFGQYSGFSKRNKLDPSFTPMYPASNFGGAFEYKVNDKFGIMGGMERQLNPMTGKWKNIPFIMPIFYGK
ncbi:MAG TPA: hypothetical protein DIT04_06530 [Dysgonomonas sp.]|nr:hypothetical protein [Dysgonomonas sp.]